MRNLLKKKYMKIQLYTSLLMGKGDTNKKCIKFKQDLEDREIFYSYYFQIRCTSSDLKVTYGFEGEENPKSKNIYFTGVIDMSGNQNKYLSICMENNKKYIIGIQFQLIGKNSQKIEDLSKLPLLPLINGFPTYFKLNPLEEMIYKIDTRQFLSNNKKIMKKLMIKIKKIVKKKIYKKKQKKKKMKKILKKINPKKKKKRKKRKNIKVRKKYPNMI